jgi:hypothetical protein
MSIEIIYLINLVRVRFKIKRTNHCFFTLIRNSSWKFCLNIVSIQSSLLLRLMQSSDINFTRDNKLSIVRYSHLILLFFFRIVTILICTSNLIKLWTIFQDLVLNSIMLNWLHGNTHWSYLELQYKLFLDYTSV